jgi:hypothetical protein
VGSGENQSLGGYELEARDVATQDGEIISTWKLIHGAYTLSRRWAATSQYLPIYSCGEYSTE